MPTPIQSYLNEPWNPDPLLVRKLDVGHHPTSRRTQGKAMLRCIGYGHIDRPTDETLLYAFLLIGEVATMSRESQASRARLAVDAALRLQCAVYKQVLGIWAPELHVSRRRITMALVVDLGMWSEPVHVPGNGECDVKETCDALTVTACKTLARRVENLLDELDQARRRSQRL